MHMNCRQSYGSCARCKPAIKPAAAAAIPMATAVGGANPGAAGQPTAPCRFCREQIIQGASKCRFCGEYQHESDRQLNQTKVRNPADDNLHWGEILLGVICALVGCILGIVYAVQGKKKGLKLILLSVLSAIFWNLIRYLIFGLQQL